MSKQILNLELLPGEPKDGSGKVCIHLFVQDPAGPFAEPYALHAGENKGEIEAKRTQGRLACGSKNSVAPVTRGRVTRITHRTDDPRAVTCPKCIASKDWQAATALVQ